VATFSPGIFTTTQDGKGMAWVINNDDGTVAQPAAGWPFPTIKTRAAQAGDNLYFYITGLGPVAPSISDGHAPCPLSGCPAGVVLPQFVGTYQVNFKMPSGIPANAKTTLQVEIGGVTSNTVTFATQ
jgi:uncharacterized protein (TIGR03437 family)